jgi:hypothetical protein
VEKGVKRVCEVGSSLTTLKRRRKRRRNWKNVYIFLQPPSCTSPVHIQKPDERETFTLQRNITNKTLKGVFLNFKNCEVHYNYIPDVMEPT